MNGTQSIEAPWGVSVFGAASVDAAPNLARLRIAVEQTPVVHIKDVDSDRMQGYRSYRGHGGDGDAGGEGDLTPGKVTVSAGVVLGLSLISG